MGKWVKCRVVFGFSTVKDAKMMAKYFYRHRILHNTELHIRRRRGVYVLVANMYNLGDMLSMRFWLDDYHRAVEKLEKRKEVIMARRMTRIKAAERLTWLILHYSSDKEGYREPIWWLGDKTIEQIQNGAKPWD